jgi:TIGR03009 family protein
MLRNLGVRRLIGLLLLAVWGASGSQLSAQDARPLDRGIAPVTDQHDASADQPRERVNRSGLTRPDLRATEADPNTGKPVDPRIEALLEEWSQRTKEIQKLQGHHLRATRDFSFGSESWAEGQFYVETPDKGRIDVRPYGRKLPDKTVPRTAPNGRTVHLTVQRDSKTDRWICDGKEIKAIDDDNKTYEAVKIPPNQRGENIMDGPLPFLFGMPPEKAKARYQFKLINETEKSYAIQVRPNWKQDAVDWTQAELLLDRKTCLPREVHLHDAAGTKETVYIFSDLQVNRIRIFFWTNPFDPPLTIAGYKRSVHNTPPAGPNSDPIAASKMPTVIGTPFKSIKGKFESLGHDVKYVRGNPATAPEQVYCVEQQQPQPNAPLDANATIILTLYDKMPPNQPQSNRSEYRNDGTRTTAKPENP